MKSLPSINALMAFDSAAKLMSFQAAANELNLTASAISHRVNALEKHCGYRLFNRLTRRISLTEQGHKLRPKVSKILLELNNIAAPIEHPVLPLKVCIPPLFFSQVMLKDLALLQLPLQLEVSQAAYRLDKFDIAIRYGKFKRKGWQSEVLLSCHHSPIIAAKIAKPSEPLNNILKKHPRIEYSYASKTWRHWLKDDQSPTQALTVSSMSEALTAVKAGMGVAILIEELIQVELATGELTRVDKNSHKSAGFYLCYKTKVSERKYFEEFRARLVQKCSEITN